TCESSTTSTQCPQSISSGQKYCYSSKVETLDLQDNVVQTVVTRGCTSTIQRQDECHFSTPAHSIFSTVHYTEHTCTNTCEGNGCNTVIPDGAHTTTKHLYCVQCEDLTGSGVCNTATTRQQCPSTSTHCISTVTYYISERVDRSYTGATPGYELRSVVRSCATAAVAAACTSTNVGSLNAKKVTCTETCQTDGCNTGWPARPLCTTCSSDFSFDINDGYDACLRNPPAPTQCAFPYHSMCVSIDRQKTTVPGYTRHMTRGCSDVSVGNVCTPSVVGNLAVLNCNYTCTTDGCNQGTNAASRPFQGMLVVTAPFVFSILVQFVLA
uniref:Uncharacterized protein n=1 Tax=Ciona savignyi TaxID=51511 RepID=H2ZC24_CIOSA